LQTLKRCSLFADTSTNDLGAIVELSEVKALAQGEYLFREGGPVRGFYVVRRGAIKVHRVNWLGKEQLIHLYRPLSRWRRKPRFRLGHHADACAIEPGGRFSPRMARAQQQPELRSVSALDASALCLLVELLDDLTLKDVKTRIAEWLVDRCPDPQSSEPCSIELDTTKRVLAAELGTASETFSRALAKFRRQKLISTVATFTLHYLRGWPASFRKIAQRLRSSGS
jgi:CRP/FNR family transcriptional regulator